MTDLAQQHPAPDGTATALSQQRIEDALPQVPGWTVEDGTLTREVKVKNFRAALDLVNAIGELAEQENHHPDIFLHSWNRVRLALYTHTAGGLTNNDFIMAAKFNTLLP